MMDYADEALSRLLAAWDGAAALVETYGPEAVAAVVRGVQVPAIIGLVACGVVAFIVLTIGAWLVRHSRRMAKGHKYGDGDPDFVAFIGCCMLLAGFVTMAAGLYENLVPAIDPIAYIAREALLP